MWNGPRVFFLTTLCIAVCSLAARGADDPKDDDKSKAAQFESVDGVQLEGRFYAAEPQGKAKSKEATVLLLHNINAKSGGSSNQPGWDDLAKLLQNDGYSVLKFDFRGFGNSTSVSPSFWKESYNKQYVRGGRAAKPPTTINHKDFDGNASEYYPYLVNDVAAAKAYLDRRNDAGQANTSSLIVIGAGEGATVGAMWMASEWHRQRVNGAPTVGIGVVLPTKLTLEDPEGRDEAAAVWLNLSPKLGNRDVSTSLHRWLAEMAGTNKVAMGFIYGDQDEASAALAKRDLGAIAYQLHNDNPSMSEEAIQNLMKKKAIGTHVLEKTKVTGSDLLTANDSDAQKWIVDKFLKSVMEERGAKESRKRVDKDDFYVWTFPPSPQHIPAKTKGEDSLRPVPVDRVLSSR
jgi:pimeloyl-ACP methyl ester carboxylesterase